MKTPVQIKTFGCKLNYYDSMVMEKQLSGLNLSNKNIYILNSCAVTAQAGKDIRKEAEKIKSSRPDSLVILTGCGAQVETELYEKSKSIDLIVGNSDRKNIQQIIANSLTKKNNRIFKSNIFKNSEVYSDFVSPDKNRTRAFLKIQDGCNSFCSFCIIPFARGKSKSLPMDFLVQSIKKLEAKDIQEVILTGVHIGDYEDRGKKIEDLLICLLKKTKIPRIRLSSLEPVEITDKLLDCYKDERMCPHFHISLQSASTPVLKSMKRKYGQKEVEEAFQKIARTAPSAFVGLDIIAGFPLETQKDFEESCQLLMDHYWTNIHVFPYSPRAGTFAEKKYTALPQKEVHQRAKLLRKISRERLYSCIQKQKGTRKKALLFKTDNNRGISRDYWKIKVPPSSRKGEHEVFIQDIEPSSGCLKGVYL